ncbi:MAG: M15 family metallopeptidase [Clostridia bacterium]|nr:M15 family metallopeptidase [Clostridia bacterium]
MDGQKIAENRPALIGLTVLVAATLLVFGLVFFDLGSVFSDDGETPPQVVAPEDPSTDNTDNVSEQIAEFRNMMNYYRTRLDSPYLIFVNEQNPLPEGYTVELASVNGADGTLRLDRAAAASMNSFLTAAENAGYSVSLQSAYRTEAEQKKVYDNAVSGYVKGGYSTAEAKSMAAAAVGSVNCSEHQLGLAVDFDPRCLTQTGNDGTTFESYLTSHIYKYGFILSFPESDPAKEATGRDANTGHYRFVGIEVAQDMQERRYATLPEYRAYLTAQITYCQQQIEALEKK